MSDPQVSRHLSLAYTVLAKTAALANHDRFGKHWQRGWSWVGRHEGVDVETQLYGSPLRLTPTAVYPAYARRWPTYNDPLVEVVGQAAAALGRPVDVVDVGAAMGDTAALLRGSCREALRSLVCVEGDPVFARYLRINTEGTGAEVVECLLSDRSTARALVRNPVGTATSVGEEGAPARTLDAVLSEIERRCDVLKIDVDGYDGRVLAGARETLRRDRPVVFFEWDPGSYERSGSDWHQPFEICEESGYSSYVWFDKYGRFTHLMQGYDRATVDAHARLCLESKLLVEWHYDVVALPAESTLDPMRLAELGFARAHKAKP